jgi:hypothetical protein
MAAETGTVYEIAPNPGRKLLLVKAGATTDNADTIAVDLTAFGCTLIDGIVGFIESTTGSIIVQEQPTTAVSAGVLTITVGGATGNKARTYWVTAY